MMIQIGIVIFSLFVISRIILRARDKKLSLWGVLFWVGLFATIIVLALMPKVMTWVSRLAGIQRGVDLFIYLSIIALFYMVFRIYIALEKLSQEITTAIRCVAILEHDFKKIKEKEDFM